MNKKITITSIGSLFFLLVLVPQAYAAELVLDDFSDGVAMVNDGGNCSFSDDAASVLGGTRGIFACIDSGAGMVTSETDTGLQQFIFTLNQADGSSGLNYDDEGNLLVAEDVTDGGTNNAFRLDFVIADSMATVTVAAADGNGKVGIFEFQFGPSGLASEFIPFDMIKDPVTMEVPDFTNLEYVGILLEGQEPNNQDTQLILGKVSTVFSQNGGNGGGRIAVGGELIPLDTTMILVSGAQNTVA